MKKETKIKCPICKGVGKIEMPASKNPNLTIILNAEYIAKQLRNKGFSFREIAKLMGYNNPQSIKHLTEK